jgi:beta-glucosidase
VVPKFPVSIQAALEAKTSLQISFVTGKNATMSKVSAAVAAADVAIVVLAQTSSEGHDRTTLELDEDNLVHWAANNNNNTRVIVVTISPGPFLMSWLDKVSAVIDMGFPGEQEGNALVDVLFGDVNPSGKMPHSMPRKWNDYNMSGTQYPGVAASAKADPPPCAFTPVPSIHFTNCTPTTTLYSEGLQIGYRWYDAHNQLPALPFGHGLSYTSFEYSSLKILKDSRTIFATVKNIGVVPGAEVVQLYLRFPEDAGEPFRQLRGFVKIFLNPDETREVSFHLPNRWVSIWNTVDHTWVIAEGVHSVMVGSSSADIRLLGNLTVSK